jgi:hypothetical protein
MGGTRRRGDTVTRRVHGSISGWVLETRVAYPLWLGVKLSKTRGAGC